MIERARVSATAGGTPTQAAGTGRRWAILAIGAVVLAAGRWLGQVPASATAIVIALGVAAAAQLALPSILRRAESVAIYIAGLFDVALVALIATLYGWGGLSVLYFLILLPTVVTPRPGMTYLLVAAASGSLVASRFLHRWWFSQSDTGRVAEVAVEAAVFLVVALILCGAAGTQAERIRRARDIMAAAAAGDLGARTPVSGSAGLGPLEAALNRFLDTISTMTGQCAEKLRELSAVADRSTKTAERMLEVSREMADVTATLSRDVSDQRELSETGRTDSRTAAEAAQGLQARAESLAGDTEQLVTAAAHGRDQVARASEILVTVGEEVRTTAVRIRDLTMLSDRIGTFVQAIGKIARQTRLLALNAAIEAARAEEHGEGFASVAEEVRLLAAQAARSAQEAAEVVAAVRAGVEAAAAAMTSGEQRVRGVGQVAGEATRALEAIHAGAADAAKRVAVVATDSREQARQMATLHGRLQQTTDLSARASAMAGEAAVAVAQQIQAVDAMTRASREAAELVEQLQATLRMFEASSPRPS